MANAGLIEITKPTKEEKDFCRRIKTHFERGALAFFVAFALAGAVLINGNYLSSRIDISTQSLLFQLWPFNNVYLRQFGAAPYSASDAQ
jgi:hypothetical protein